MRMGQLGYFARGIRHVQEVSYGPNPLGGRRLRHEPNPEEQAALERMLVEFQEQFN